MNEKNIPFKIYRGDGEGNLKEIRQYKPKSKSTNIQKKPIRKNKSSFFKNLLSAAAVTAAIAGTATVSYFINKNSKNSHSSTSPSKNIEINNVEKIIAQSDYDGNTYYFVRKDSLMKEISTQRTYFDFEKLKVNKDSLHMAYSLAKNLTLTEMMEIADIRGMARAYSGHVNGKIHLETALKGLWILKTKKMNGRFAEIKDKFIEEYDSDTTKKSSLSTYKSKINKELDTILAGFDYESFYLKHNNPAKKIGHSEKQRFFENYFSKLDSNMLTSYGITELFSAETNPVFNIILLDKFLKEGGEEFINKIPAIHDEFLSYGFFQLTSKIITPVGAPSLNKYLDKELQIPQSMKYYDTSEEHIRGAILVNIYNAEILVNTLYQENLLTDFNNGFEQLTPEEQEVFIAGYASAAHHASTTAANAVCNYQKKVNLHLKRFKDIIPDLPLKNKLRRYYEQSLKNYITLKELDMEVLNEK